MKIVKKIEELDVLGLNIGISNKGTAGTDFSERRRDNGFIFNSDKMETFKLPHITEVDGNVIIYNSEMDSSLNQVFKDDFDISSIEKLVDFLLKLKIDGVTLPEFSSNMIYSNSNNDFVIFPPAIIEFINNRESLDKKLSDVSLYRHPDLKGEKAILYSIGILLFQSTTKSYPITYNDVEDLRDKMRRKKLVEARWRDVKISDRLNDLINELLDIENSLDLQTLKNRLQSITTEGIYREDGDYTQEEALNKQKEKRLLLWEKRRSFVIKYKGLIVGGSITSLLLIIFFGTIIANALKPPLTAGFSASQVVETYFESFQTLNPELIDDVLAKGVRNNDSTEISTLYVTTKMRTQTDPTSTILSPSQWLALPDENRDGKDVYGIYNLKIKMLENNVYQASYEKWYTQAEESDDLSNDVVLDVYKIIRVEIFTLNETKYSYEIANIETISERSDRVW
ncbi:hypothetical protein EW093_12335 [Thiospirochaeta perfilievii]|uniref:Protein kinase domain-containing protein n=1 Tax=Thiospirochaeta perfilievii TaxID=252967 RepID=A0A5C1QDM8_9SPIO|nr:hypothetical protein [Thiospirochaeta perfilievii]QEN05468.1 hypothetical protein EW093_12335 [Thiospirochaeta perfilievii]